MDKYNKLLENTTFIIIVIINKNKNNNVLYIAGVNILISS